MKDHEHDELYIITLEVQQATLTKPQTFLQHISTTDELSRVLYIVSPGYVFLMEVDGRVAYDDPAVTDLGWEALAQQQYHFPGTADLDKVGIARQIALECLVARKSSTLQK